MYTRRECIMADTALTTWLRDNNAGDDVIEAFSTEGYLEVDEIDEEDIKKLVKKSGVQKRLTLALAKRAEAAKAKEEAAKPKEKEKRQPMPPPDLPSGTTLDLSARELKHADVKFEVPTALSVEKGELGKPPGELKNEEWMVLAKRRSILCGFDMSGREPTLSREPVRFWKVPDEERHLHA